MPTNSHAPSSVSRRRVIRVGATAAWTTPVIAVATTAPAIADSTTAPRPKLTTEFTMGPTRTSTQNPFQGSLALTVLVYNPYDYAISSVQVSMLLKPDNYTVSGFSRSTSDTPTGWTISPIGGGNTNPVTTDGTFTFVYTLVGSLAAKTAVELSPTITLAGEPGSGTVTVQSNADMSQASAAVTATFS